MRTIIYVLDEERRLEKKPKRGNASFQRIYQIRPEAASSLVECVSGSLRAVALDVSQLPTLTYFFYICLSMYPRRLLGTLLLMHSSG
jgi:hypothetical protein